jgi:protein-S-isoprenylcysteine O-methyltransferase Ste14
MACGQPRRSCRLIVIDRGVIAREERYLDRKFGEQYRRYQEGTRRWL